MLLAAYADELSLIVRTVTPDGLLRVLPGERDQFAAPVFFGGPLRILADGGPLPGILATTTGHARTPEQREDLRMGWDDVFVGVGVDTLLVAPPIPYSHSPFEAVDPGDVETTVRLFEAYLAREGENDG